MTALALFNGHLLPADAVRLPLPNRGLYYNDGFFETMVWATNRVRYLPHHLTRMQRAAAALGLELPRELATAETLSDTLRRLADSHAQDSGVRIRLQLWRSGSGLYTPETSAVDWLATSQAFRPQTAAVTSCAFAETIRTHASPVAFCKGPNTLTYVLAARERQQRGLDEIILLSDAGCVAETVSAAVAWIRHDTIYTPAEEAGIIAGTRLAHLRATALQEGIKWQEGEFSAADVLAAEAVFTANVAGIRAVQQVQQTVFNTEKHSLFLRLLDAESQRA